MLVMEQSYHRRLLEGTWNPKLARTDKEQIIALEAKILELASNSPNSEKSEKGDKNANKWAWKKVPPCSGQPHSMKQNKKEYHWCPKHKLWCIHHPDECKLGQNAPVMANETITQDAAISVATTPTSTSTMQVDPVLNTIINGTGRIFT
jgi:hypothetical protein